VTLADEAPPERISAAMEALGNYSAVVEADRAVLLEERERHWWPLADACFGAPAIVGRGGLDLVMVEGRLLGPDVLALFDAEQAVPEGGLVPDRLCGTVLTGLRDDRVVGAASAWRERATGATHAGVLVEAGSRNQGVGRALLMAVEAAMARLGWAPERVIGHGPAAFFTACSASVRAPG
jgi:GNAT superfamily N-acetyltransferase